MKTKILLDTTYLLPIFGVSVDIKNFSSDFNKVIDESSVQASSLSLLEIKFKILKLSRTIPKLKERYLEGIKSIHLAKEIDIINFYLPEIEEASIDLYKHHKDVFDCVILATALKYSDILVTEDVVIHSLAKQIQREKGEIRPKTFHKKLETITWKKLIQSTFSRGT